VAEPVLLVAGLLANEHQRCGQRPFAEHRLRRKLPDGAFAAAVRRRAQRGVLTIAALLAQRIDPCSPSCLCWALMLAMSCSCVMRRPAMPMPRRCG
jgi:hypothetical protein